MSEQPDHDPKIPSTPPEEGGAVDLERSVVLEIDGPDVSPATIDAPTVLELAAAFFALVRGNAEERQAPLTLRGVSVIDKCAAIVVPVDLIDVAQFAAQAASMQIAGETDTPRGLSTLAERAQKALRKLPESHKARIKVGTLERGLTAGPEPPPSPLDSLLSLRAIPIRAGKGSRDSTVRFVSEMEDEPFTLDATLEQARHLGALLSREVDITARVSRAPEGFIVRGELETFFPVEDTDPRPAWRAWYRAVGGEWDQIEDLEGELKR